MNTLPFVPYRRLLFLLAVLALTLPSCAEKLPAAVDEHLRPVRTMLVEARPTESAKPFSGVVQATDELRLSFPQGGTISELLVTVGQRLEEGELIAQLDTRSIEAQLSQASAAVAQANAQLKSAKREQETLAKLLASGGASRLDYERASGNVDAASANVSAAKQRERQLQASSDDTTLRASSAGIVAAVYVSAGEVVGPGAPVVSLNTGDTSEVLVAVPASSLGSISVGDKAQLSAPHLKVSEGQSNPASHRAGSVPESEPMQLGPTTLEGEVVEKGITPKPGSVTYDVIVRLAEAHPELHVGMAVTATFELPVEASPKVFVPSNAIGSDAGGDFLFVVEVVDGAPIAKKRLIKTGRVSSDGIEIREGLSAGERLVTAGVHSLQDGERIVLKED